MIQRHHFRYIPLIVLLLHVLCRPLWAIAREPVILDHNSLNGQLIGTKIEYLVDDGHRYDINTIQSAEASARFKRCISEELTLGYSNSATWVRFIVSNPENRSIDWYLECANPYHRNVELFIPYEKGFTVKKTTNWTPAFKREFNAINFIFSLSEPPGLRLYYMRYVTDTTLHIPLRT